MSDALDLDAPFSVRLHVVDVRDPDRAKCLACDWTGTLEEVGGHITDLERAQRIADRDRLVAELRTARAERAAYITQICDEQQRSRDLLDESMALAARIAGAAAIQRKYPGGESDPVMLQRAVGWNECLDAVRAALSGATEPTEAP